MDTAEAALNATHPVAAKDIEIVSRVPRIVLRITVPASTPQAEDAEALQAAANMAEAVAGVATTGRLEVLRRDAGRWVPLSGGADPSHAPQRRSGSAGSR